jgi:hypothetical protein
MVILNDVDLANEMLDRRGATNSDRPVLNMVGELAGFKEWTVLLRYGPRLKESRKYIHRAIGKRESLRKFDGLFNAEDQRYLKATLRDPDNVWEHIRRCISGTLYIPGIRSQHHIVLQVQSSFALFMVTKYKRKGIPSSRLQNLPSAISRISPNQELI